MNYQTKSDDGSLTAMIIGLTDFNTRK